MFWGLFGVLFCFFAEARFELQSNTSYHKNSSYIRTFHSHRIWVLLTPEDVPLHLSGKTKRGEEWEIVLGFSTSRLKLKHEIIFSLSSFSVSSLIFLNSVFK